MTRLKAFKCALIGGASVLVLAHPVAAREFDVPRGDLADALDIYTQQAGVQLIYSNDAVRGRRTNGVKGDYTEVAALSHVLSGTGFTTQTMPSSAIGVVPQDPPQPRREPVVRVAAAARPSAPPSGIETITVTAERKREDIQNVPIAVSAFTQKDLKERQVATGGDLIRETPNMNFGKTNFAGYSIELRGIGTQAISVTTDPAVAVAFNGIPFLRNHFFEQEFFDLENVEVLRGPQGTLYGRNATAGVVNLTSAKPTDQFEAIASVDLGNYSNRRLEAMLNLPIVDDRLDLRIAGEWTVRNGYSHNEITNSSIDGRDLWSSRVSLSWKPDPDLQFYLVWEHFSEDDDRLRSGKQLCKTAQPPTSVNGVPVPPASFDLEPGVLNLDQDYLSQGCEASSLYSPDAFQVPYGFSLPYAVALGVANDANASLDPYASTLQSRNLRVIESTINPRYRAKNDIIELNADYNVTPSVTLTSQTGYNQDYLSSTQDYNRFNTSPGIFIPSTPVAKGGAGAIDQNGVFCDPQLGCANRLVAEDLNNEHSWQLNQEFRLASNFDGPFNFSVGGNLLHYETEENYYVFINALSLFAIDAGSGIPILPYVRGITDNHQCLPFDSGRLGGHAPWGYQNPSPTFGGGEPTQTCIYMDPNPISKLNNYGHNYFLSQNPYTLNSYAAFGEAYYNITDELKLTGGLRWTDDRKHFTDIPSEVITNGYGYPVSGIVIQQWNEFTGRGVVNWTPKLDFTDQTLVYGSFSRGYKAGGANPPGAILGNTGFAGVSENPIHPLTFRPEFINAVELGTKNTLLDGTLTLNADIFYYAYKDYQISEIVDRTSINLNFNAKVKGAELESTWEPLPGLRFNFAGGYEETRIDDGQSAVDLMDRTAGMPGWMVVKPFVDQASNCILPTYVVAAILEEQRGGHGANPAGGEFACSQAYTSHFDPATFASYVPNPTAIGDTGFGFPIPPGYPGFNPATAPNGGQGFSKPLGGHKLPNAPPFTVSFGAQYTTPVAADWAATLRGDFYWQANSWARVFNDNPYDRLRGYTNVNLALILNSTDGWQVMGYVKNVFNTTAITGDFLNSDDSGLTTNVFLTDPRLFGVRVTKDFGAPGGGYGLPELFTDLFSDSDGKPPSVWIELGGMLNQNIAQGDRFSVPFIAANPTSPVLKPVSPRHAENPEPFSFGEDASISIQPQGSDWLLSASLRIGRSSNFKHVDHQTNTPLVNLSFNGVADYVSLARFADTQSRNRESHTILDFTAGKDVGLGFFGLEGTSEISGGIRFAQLSSVASLDVRARPDLRETFKYTGPFKQGHFYFHTYHVTGQASRSMHGVGPTISWNGSTPISGDARSGEVDFDWGANAAVLFGKQRARIRHQATGRYAKATGNQGEVSYSTSYQRTGGHNSLKSIVVPNLGGFAGISMRYLNAKVSFGYRADMFFGAMDGGIDAHKSENVGFFGPFAHISIGLGG